MRRKSNSFFALMILSIVFISGCATSFLYMDVLVPGQISVPQQVQKIGVINRSLPAKQNLALNILEGFITGESIMGDRESSEHCVRGFALKINDGPRFKAVFLDGLEMEGTGTREWPMPINWSQVESVCSQYGVDALVVLETYDSNTGLRQWEETKKRKKDGQEIMYKEYNAQLVVNMYSGWRIYFPATKRILDQNSYMDEKAWRTNSESSSDALRKLPPKRRALNEAGAFAGMQYAFRISPSWIKVQREYYVKGHKYLETTKPMVKKSNWKDAVEFWKTLAESKDPKIAGRACYNMALASEMDGDLELAMQWAEIAWQKHELNKAKSYINTLSTRIMHQQRLKEQMQGE